MVEKSDVSKWVTYPARVGVGAVVGAGVFLLGRSFEVPGSAEFWDLAAQPLATSVAGAGAIAAGLLALHNGAKTRALDGAHHQQTMDRDREMSLRDRYTTAAEQLNNENSAVREAGAYALAALVEDWLRYGDVPEQTSLAHSQARACINLLCSYLRANRRATPSPADDPDSLNGFEREEAFVRDSIISVIRENSTRWMTIQTEWIRDGRIHYNTRIRLNLSSARLRNADLSGATLTLAKLEDTDLEEANLTAVFLNRADLTGAKLVKARLKRCTLEHANLLWANFGDADLTEARLVDANLDRASFRGAQLDAANLSEAFAGGSARFDDETQYSSKTTWPLGVLPQGKKIPTKVRGRSWTPYEIE